LAFFFPFIFRTAAAVRITDFVTCFIYKRQPRIAFPGKDAWGQAPWQ
jgi:hypothetical protein